MLDRDACLINTQPKSTFSPLDPFYHINELELYELHQKEAADHWLYQWIPRHRTQMVWYDARWLGWALFGNDDDEYLLKDRSHLFKPNYPDGLKKAGAWMLRNPLHNFCYYVIGSAGCINNESTIFKLNEKGISYFTYERIATTVFAGKGTSIFLGLHGGKPFFP